MQSGCSNLIEEKLVNKDLYDSAVSQRLIFQHVAAEVTVSTHSCPVLLQFLSQSDLGLQLGPRVT